jgi:hypothetical protein
MPETRPPIVARPVSWRVDLLLVLGLALGTYALSSALEFSERLSRWLAHYEGIDPPSATPSTSPSTGSGRTR